MKVVVTSVSVQRYLSCGESVEATIAFLVDPESEPVQPLVTAGRERSLVTISDEIGKGSAGPSISTTFRTGTGPRVRLIPISLVLW